MAWSSDPWSEVDVNVAGMVRVAGSAHPHRLRSGYAPIVNTHRAVAWTGVVQWSLPSTSKGAAVALTCAMAPDHLAADGGMASIRMAR